MFLKILMLKIRVVAVNPSLFDQLQIQVFLEGFSFCASFEQIDIVGDDAKRYLQGQSTNNVYELVDRQSQLNVLLNSKGRIIAPFTLKRINETSFCAYVYPSLASKFKARLEQYIVADDIEIQERGKVELGLFSRVHEPKVI